MRTSYFVLFAAATAAAAACKSNNNAAADSSGGNVSSAAAADSQSSLATPAPNPAPTANAANVLAATPASGDGAILAQASVGDSAEVAIAGFVGGATKNAAVKAYAAELQRDHGKGLREVQKTSKQLSIPMQLPASDTTAQGTAHVMDHLKSLSGNDLDTAFANHEIEDHQHDIEDAKQMAASAQAPQVKTLLQKELPELQRHLADAKKLAGRLGVKK